MGKRAKKQLTQKLVNELVPPRTGYKDVPDGVVPGLVLRVSASYRKSFYLWFRVRGRNTVRKLGDHPGMTLAAARALAGDARESGNPLAFLGGPEDTRKTVEEIVALYSKGRLDKLKSGDRSRARLKRHVVPAWGAMIAEELTRAQMTELTDRLTENHGPGECLAVYQLVQAMLRWSVGKGHIERNPLEGYEAPHKVGTRDRVLSDEELHQLWTISYELKGSPFGPILRILILTGLRRSEAAGLQGREIGDEWITIPGSRMKSGDDHRVPITPLLKVELDGLPKHQGDLLTAKGQTTAFSGFGKAKQLVDARIDLEKPWQIHDIRRSVRSGLAALKINRDIAERCIGHKVGSKLDKVYDHHSYGPQIAEAMTLWSNHIRDLVTEPPDNLVKLQR